MNKPLLYSRREHLVFRYQAPAAPPHASGLEVRSITRDNVGALFGDDPRRRETFKTFLKQGMKGYVLCQGDAWATYGWLRPPGCPAPPHLPPWLRRLEVFWIFYCRTEEAFRGRGYYKLLLEHLVEAARSEGDTDIYIDTAPENLPARKAIRASGFVPAGVIRTASLRIPKTKTLVWGRWARSALHPSLAGSAPNP